MRDAFEGRCVDYKSEKDKNSTITEYLERDRPHLGNMTNDLKESRG